MLSIVATRSSRVLKSTYRTVFSRRINKYMCKYTKNNPTKKLFTIEFIYSKLFYNRFYL